MKRSWKYWLVGSVVVSALGGVGIVLLSVVMLHLEFEVSPAGFCLLIAVVLLSLISGFVDSVVLSLVAVLSLDYIFTPPIYSMTIGTLADVVAAIAFLTKASVRDSGVGLDAEKLQHIFEAFHTTKSKGMGMGLTISRSIIEAHGGRLWATPNKPRGATFQLTLPAIQGNAS